MIIRTNLKVLQRYAVVYDKKNNIYNILKTYINIFLFGLYTKGNIFKGTPGYIIFKEISPIFKNGVHTSIYD